MNGLKYYRLLSGKTQREISSALNIDRTTVAKWENEASKPRALLLPKLAELLSCTTDDLLKKDSQLDYEALMAFACAERSKHL